MCHRVRHAMAVPSCVTRLMGFVPQPILPRSQRKANVVPNEIDDKNNQDTTNNGKADISYWPLIPMMGAIAGALAWHYVISLWLG